MGDFRLAGEGGAGKAGTVLSRHVDDFVSEVGTLKTKVTATEGTVADAKSVADEVNQWKQRGIGALFVRQIASAAVSGSRRLCGHAILKALRAQQLIRGWRFRAAP
jgi:hypothetical protein